MRSPSPLALLTGVCLALAALLGGAGPARPDDSRSASGDFAVGFNQGWIEGAWARDLTSGFDEAAWRRVLRRTRESGGSVLRVWLFEDRALEGVVWEGHRPARVDPRMLDSVRAIARIAAEEGVRIYWTGTDGNWFWEKSGLPYDRVWNVLNDRFGYGRAFRENVLGPVIDAIAERPDAVYGFDIVNELQGPVTHWLFPDGWDGARRYVRETASFIHARAPALRVTASAGHHTAARDILDGRFDGLGLDFLDVHVYDDRGRIPSADRLVAHARARGLPIVLGEHGQASDRMDDALQARVTAAFLEQARRAGFAGAFAWRLEDRQEGGRRFSFFDGDRPRPAVDVVRRFARTLPPPPRPASPETDPPQARDPCPGLNGALSR